MHTRRVYGVGVDTYFLASSLDMRLFTKYSSCDTATMAPSNEFRASHKAALVAVSKWFVGCRIR